MTSVILIHHPKYGYARVTERALQLVWEPKGWTQVDPDRVTKDELMEAADDLGVPVSKSKTKTKIADDLAGDAK